MYTTILHFIIVLSLYSFYDQAAAPRCSARDALLGMIAGYAAFGLVTRIVFARFEARYGRGGYGLHQFATLHARRVDRCSVLAVVLFGVFVYGLDLPYHGAAALGLPSGGALNSLCGIAVYFGMLLIVWDAAYPAYRRFYHHEARRTGYIGSHARMAVSVVVPWLLCAGAFDLLAYVPWASDAVRESAAAQYGATAVVVLGVGLVYPRLLVRLWGCSSLPQGTVRRRLEAFCNAARCRCADIMLWNLYDGRMITAGVLGFVPPFRYLLISPALLGLLDEDELDAVAAHEIGHVRHRHLLFYIVFVLGYLLIAGALFESAYLWLVSGAAYIDFVLTPEGRAGTVFVIGTGLASLLLLLGYFRGVFGLFSRNFERQADGCAVKLIGTGAGIASSLAKIAGASGVSQDASNWHHYGIRERIEYITRCTADPALVARHDRRVRRMVAGYGIGLLAAASLLVWAHDRLGGISRTDLLQKAAEQRLAADPDNAALHLLLANIYFEQHRFEDAEAHYRATLRLEPLHSEALNNLAWLYATAEDERFRDPEEALRLALRAAALDPQPHILDTLAESYFVNGAYDEAIATIKQAIAQKPADAAYYQRQLEKYEEKMRAGPAEEAPREPDDERVAL